MRGDESKADEKRNHHRESRFLQPAVDPAEERCHDQRGSGCLALPSSNSTQRPPNVHAHPEINGNPYEPEITRVFVDFMRKVDAREAGLLSGRLARSGRMMGTVDVQIAGMARARGQTLLATDRRFRELAAEVRVEKFP